MYLLFCELLMHDHGAAMDEFFSPHSISVEKILDD
jgi:hypothetical protein